MSWFGNTGRQPAPEKKPLNIDADRANTNQQAIPVPYMAGRQRVALIFAAPIYNQVNKPVKTKTGKSSKQTTGYIYYGDVMGLICMGGRARVTKLFKHIIDGEIAWRNDGGLAAGVNPSEPVTLTDYGSTWIYWGSATQPVDTNVLTPIGAPPGGGFDPRDQTTWPNTGGGGNSNIQHPLYEY